MRWCSPTPTLSRSADALCDYAVILTHALTMHGYASCSGFSAALSQLRGTTHKACCRRSWLRWQRRLTTSGAPGRPVCRQLCGTVSATPYVLTACAAAWHRWGTLPQPAPGQGSACVSAPPPAPAAVGCYLGLRPGLGVSTSLCCVKQAAEVGRELDRALADGDSLEALVALYDRLSGQYNEAKGFVRHALAAATSAWPHLLLHRAFLWSAMAKPLPQQSSLHSSGMPRSAYITSPLPCVAAPGAQAAPASSSHVHNAHKGKGPA